MAVREVDTRAQAPAAGPREAFERDGYVVLEGALSSIELERLDQAVGRMYGAERADGGPLHLLAFCGRDAAFLRLVDHPSTLPLVVEVLGPNIFMYHCHLDVHPPEPDGGRRPWMWHQDGGIVNRDLEGSPRPRLAVKVAYFLSDVAEPGRGNFVVLPGSHRSNAIARPPDDDNDVPGAVPILARAGDAVLFDRRLWHMRGRNASAITRRALFYAYTFRWVRARDDLVVRADLLHLVTPVRAQLLGAGASAIDFWMPDEVELPVRDAARRR
jgi:ectoine hydroxylase-related dioxygenase (phytanoyl-CoA dioxygenase family)